MVHDRRMQDEKRVTRDKGRTTNGSNEMSDGWLVDGLMAGGKTRTRRWCVVGFGPENGRERAASGMVEDHVFSGLVHD